MAEWSQGPDVLIETDSATATKLGDAVKIRNISNRLSVEKVKPISLYTKFKEITTQSPNHPALVSSKADKYVEYSYSQFWALSNKVAKSFIKVKSRNLYNFSYKKLKIISS